MTPPRASGRLEMRYNAFMARLRAWSAPDSGIISEALSRRVWERDRVCVYCGSDVALEIDHVLPWSRGGPTIAGNLVLACRPCNGHKGARVSAYLMARAFRHLLDSGEDLTWTDAPDARTHTLPRGAGNGSVPMPVALKIGKPRTLALPARQHRPPRARTVARATPAPRSISGSAPMPVAREPIGFEARCAVCARIFRDRRNKDVPGFVRFCSFECSRA
jgi:5-methylcytosine-specific restriction endonuclease McrA